MKHRSAISVFRPRLLVGLLLLPALLAAPAQAASHESHPSHESHSPIAFSLAPESAVTEYARKTWDFWSRAQTDPALADEFAEPQNSPDSPNPSHFVHPTPYLALRIDADPSFTLPPLEHELPPDFPFDRLACRFDIFAAATNELPGLDLFSPVFADLPRLHTETVTLPALPATVPLPSALSDGGLLLFAHNSSVYSASRRYYFCLVVRVTLLDFVDPCNDPIPIAATILPPFQEHSSTYRILASDDLPPDIWQSAKESYEHWTPSDYPAAIPDFLPARAPHTVVLSPGDLAAMADRPVLARRLALSGTAVHVPGAENPLLPADPALSADSVLFPPPSTSAKHVSPAKFYPLNHNDLPTAFLPPSAVRSAFPVYAAWVLLPFLVAAVAAIVLLVVLFRRPPARRTAIWIVLPAVSLGLALLFLLAVFLFLPRTPVADRLLVRVGHADSPEEWCRASIRCFSFRPVDWTFAFPSADAGVVASAATAPHLASRLFRWSARNLATLDFPRGVPSTAFTVDAAWFAPADFPLQVRPAAEPPGEDTPLNQTREITVSRDLDDLWVVIATNYYHVGPVPAGTTLHPRPWEIVATNFLTLPPPFAHRLPATENGCGCPDPAPTPMPQAQESQESPSSLPEALAQPPQPASPDSWRWAPRAPWITIARAPAIDPAPHADGTPDISPETRATAQTLWITEWP